MGISALATYVKPRKRRWRKMRPVYGVCVHTTGRGLVKAAIASDRTPMDMAVNYYSRTAGPHFVIDYSGNIAQIQDDCLRGAHIGVSRSERRLYLSNAWRRDFPDAAVLRWRSKWPMAKSPQHLFPGKRPNDNYIGVELIPLMVSAANMLGMWFTDEQHEAVALLCKDIAIRHRFPRGWQYTSRLVGHEDVDAYGRWDKSGNGWDPGALRDIPRLDWASIRAIIG